MSEHPAQEQRQQQQAQNVATLRAQSLRFHRLPPRYLSFYKLSELELRSLEGELLHQLGSYIGRRERFLTLDEQITMAKARVISFNPLDVWEMYSLELAVVAKALLTITASEAAVERSFSAHPS